MKLILGPIVGAVTHKKAKVWIFGDHSNENETAPQCLVFKDEKCTKKVFQSPFETVSSSVHESDAIHGLAGLAEISFPSGREKIYFKIVSPSADEGQNDRIYTIRPFPKINAGIDTLSFGLISCHRPTLKPDDKEETVARMWRYLGDMMNKHDCRFLCQVGDQVYCDHDQFNAWEMSLEAESPEKRLWYYREAYLKHWNFPEVQEVVRTFPQYMIWDDHEITNGWGSSLKHSKDDKCRKVFEVARQVFFEFQHSHNPDPLRKGEHYFAFNHGPVAFLFMDIRGHRDIALYNPLKPDEGYPSAGEQQWEDIQAWLNSDTIQQSKAMFVITSVPVIHLNRKFGSLGIFKNDINDQWSTAHNKKERRLLLKVLYEWIGETNRPVFILSGDVHVGTFGKITELETGRVVHQISASPITYDPAYYLDFFLQKWSGEFDFHLEDDQKGPIHGEITERYRRRNFAIITVQFKEQTPQVTLNMYEERQDEPVKVEFF